jgi:hypothetical protein
MGAVRIDGNDHVNNGKVAAFILHVDNDANELSRGPSVSPIALAVE